MDKKLLHILTSGDVYCWRIKKMTCVYSSRWKLSRISLDRLFQVLDLGNWVARHLFACRKKFSSHFQMFKIYHRAMQLRFNIGQHATSVQCTLYTVHCTM